MHPGGELVGPECVSPAFSRVNRVTLVMRVELAALTRTTNWRWSLGPECRIGTSVFWPPRGLTKNTVTVNVTVCDVEVGLGFGNRNRAENEFVFFSGGVQMSEQEGIRPDSCAGAASATLCARHCHM